MDFPRKVHKNKLSQENKKIRYLWVSFHTFCSLVDANIVLLEFYISAISRRGTATWIYNDENEALVFVEPLSLANVNNRQQIFNPVRSHPPFWNFI